MLGKIRNVTLKSYKKSQNMSNKTIKNDKITNQKDEKHILIKKKIEDDVLTRYRNKHIERNPLKNNNNTLYLILQNGH